jgi:hypothetical protein
MPSFPNGLKSVTAAPGTNTTEVATCAFVLANGGGGGGGGSPGGSSGQVQYNDAGVFGGGPSWDATAVTLGVGPGFGTATAARGMLDASDTGGFPKPMVSFRRPNSGDWGITLGNEPIAHVYIGLSGSITNWFWRANWDDTTKPVNTFQIAQASSTSLVTMAALAVAAQTGDLFQCLASDGTVLASVDVAGVFHGGGSGLTGIAESQVTNLVADLAARAPLDSPSFTGPVNMPSHYGAIAADADAATITFDLAASDKHKVTLGGNRTLAVSNAQVGQTFLVVLVQDATGSRTVTWWSGIKWAGGTAPTPTTTPNKTDIFTFICYSAGNYYGFISGQNY